MIDAKILYTAIQIAHNFGAVILVGGTFFAIWPLKQTTITKRMLGWLILAGWILQGMSGASFGMISFIAYGKLPDIHGIAMGALVLKIICTMIGFTISVLYLKNVSSEKNWMLMTVCSSVAMIAAAFLRWFA